MPKSRLADAGTAASATKLPGHQKPNELRTVGDPQIPQRRSELSEGDCRSLRLMKLGFELCGWTGRSPAQSRRLRCSDTSEPWRRERPGSGRRGGNRDRVRARLRVADCFAGRLADSPYFIEYERRSIPWLMALGVVDGEDVVIIMRDDPKGISPFSVIRMEILRGRIVSITDYVKCSWLIDAAVKLTVT